MEVFFIMENSKKRSPARMICQIAILIALEIVLNRFCSINALGLKIGISFLPMAVCAVLYGPIWTAAAWFLADFIGAVLWPLGPYFVPLGISVALKGLCFGLFLNKKPIPDLSDKRFLSKVAGGFSIGDILNMLCAVAINIIIITQIIDSYWISVLYSSKGGFMYWFTMRIPQSVVLVVVQMLFLPIIMKLTNQLKRTAVLA